MMTNQHEDKTLNNLDEPDEALPEGEHVQGNGEGGPTPVDHETTAPPPPSPPPPRGPRLWVLLTVGLAVFLTAGLALWLGAVFNEPLGRAMHHVEQIALGAGEDAEHTHDGQYWTCGMHPWVVLPEPGLCPICHMDLTPLDPGKLTGEIAIDPVMVQNIGVRIAPAVTGPLSKEIRTVGTVTYNESAVRDVNTKIAGWIEELYVDQTGVRVEQGEPLFELYSPELYAAQEEYLLAWRNRDRVNPDFLPGAAQTGIDLLESARTRLEYFDISEAQIQQLRETGQPTKTLTIASPHAGVVIDKQANEGMQISPGMRVYRIADLSTVWVMATIYEHQLPFVEVGQKATMTLPYRRGETFEGEVAYIYPYLDEQARAARVRLAFPNPDGQLKPGMFATVELERTLEEQAVLVPRDAIVGTGGRQMAFVSLGGGRFEPREVETGVETEGGMVQLLQGVEPGEQVVVSGQFLLDSESKMRLALAKMIEGDMASAQTPTVKEAQASEVTALPDEVAQGLRELLDRYFAIGDQLAADTVEETADRARAIAELMEEIVQHELPGHPHFWHQREAQVRTIQTQARALADAADLEEARLAYGVLSDALERLLIDTGVPAQVEPAVDRRICGMFGDAPRKGVWLQPAEVEVRNPYMGTKMLGCNLPDEHLRLPVTGGAAPASATQPAATQPAGEGE